jgi:hypothetical protein
MKRYHRRKRSNKFTTLYHRSDYNGFNDEPEKAEKKETVNLSEAVNMMRKVSGCC